MEVLSRRIGPVPVWLAGALVAAGFWWFFLRGKGQQAAGATAQPGPNSIYGLGFAQGQQAAGAQAPQPPAANAARTARVVAPWDNIITVTPQGPTTQAQQTGRIPTGQTVTITGDPVAALWNQEQFQAVPVSYQGAPVGYVDIRWLQPVSGAGGVGGASRKHAVGSRAAAPVWHDAHPLIGAPVKYAHYVRAVGGPRNHRAEVSRVARQAGVHPARVAMLNPHYTGRIRIA